MALNSYKGVDQEEVVKQWMQAQYESFMLGHTPLLPNRAPARPRRFQRMRNWLFEAKRRVGFCWQVLRRGLPGYVEW